MLTLIIPTFDRPQRLARVIKYYFDSRFPFEIVIADSSSEPALEANRRVVNSAKTKLRIDYQVYPSDISIFLKLVRALETSTAPYAVVCADDDFIVSSSMQTCVQFLESNHDYAVAHGNSTIVEVSVEAQDKAAPVFSAWDYPQRSNDLPDPLQRLVNHLEQYTTTFYSVQRRHQLAHNLHQAFENTVDYRFGELLPSCLSVIDGKVARLDVLFMVRQGEAEPAAATEKYGANMTPWTELAQHQDFSSRYANFENCLIQKLGAQSRISPDQAQPAIHAAFQAYLRRAANLEVTALGDQAETQSRLGAAASRARRLVGSFPAVMQELVNTQRPGELVSSPRGFYQKVQAKRNKMSLASLTDSRSAFHDDFRPIYQLLLNYPNGLDSGTPVDA